MQTQYQNRYLLLIVCSLAISYFFLFDFMRWNQFDSPSFVGGARLIFDLDGGYDFQARISKPFPLLLPGLLEYMFGLQSQYGFIIQNCLYFLILPFVLFKIFEFYIQDIKRALWGVIMYYLFQPFAIFSLFVLSDITGWFWGILGIYFYLYYIKNRNFSFGKTVLFSLIIVLGFFHKESAVIVPIFYSVDTIISNDLTRNKIYQWLGVGAFSLILMLTGLFLTQYFFRNDVVQRILNVREVYGPFNFLNLQNLLQLFHAFDLGWLLFIPGVWLNVKNNSISWSILIIMFLILFLFPLVYPFMIDRLLFIVAPLFVIFCLKGLDFFHSKRLPIIVIGFGLTQIIGAYLIYKYNTNGVLIWELCIGVLLIFITLNPQKSKKNEITP